MLCFIDILRIIGSQFGFYIDDIILLGDDETGLADLMENLANEFQIKDLGHSNIF